MIAWGAAPEAPAAEIGEIHLWRVDQSAAGGPVGELARVLSADERARMERYRFPRDRRRYGLRRSALRRILAAYVGGAPADVALVLAARSKPELAEPGDPPLRFNVSHSEETALVAVTRGPALGVDIEFIRPMEDRDSVARRVFSPTELLEYEALPEAERPAGFFNGWTRKEAFLKAQGEGLFGDLAGFDVTLAPGREARLLRVAAAPDEAARWTLLAFTPAEGAAGAIAVRGDATRLSSWTHRPPA